MEAFIGIVNADCLLAGLPGFSKNERASTTNEGMYLPTQPPLSSTNRFSSFRSPSIATGTTLPPAWVKTIAYSFAASLNSTPARMTELVFPANMKFCPIELIFLSL